MRINLRVRLFCREWVNTKLLISERQHNESEKKKILKTGLDKIRVEIASLREVPAYHCYLMINPMKTNYKDF